MNYIVAQIADSLKLGKHMFERSRFGIVPFLRYANARDVADNLLGTYPGKDGFADLEPNVSQMPKQSLHRRFNNSELADESAERFPIGADTFIDGAHLHGMVAL